MINELIKKIYKSFLENRILSRWVVLFIDFTVIFCATSISYFISIQIYKNLGVIRHPDFLVFTLITVAANLIFFLICKTHQGIIRYSSTHDFSRIILALALADLSIFIVLYQFISPSGSVALAYTCILFMVSLIGLLSFRFSVIYIYQMMTRKYRSKPLISVYLWGMNHDNIAFAKTLNANEYRYRIRGIIDNYADKKLRRVTNLKVLELPDTKTLNKLKGHGVLFADIRIVRERKDLIEFFINESIPVYLTQEVDIKNAEQLNDAIHHIRSIQIEDLLGRPQIDISMDIIASNIKNKTVLVTGAAGSIGSEIVRQLANFSPKKIICFDQAETALNDLHLELEKNYPNLNFISIIGDVKNQNKLNKVFTKYQPNIVYHAAAYKHVPMMENNPCEAIMTNVLGTKLLVDMAISHHVEMFIMVSTDKAVNPTNIMGASKRIAEIYVQSIALSLKEKAVSGGTKFVTTRFGNVLGSNGSVIPLFRKQIEKGEAITVTHPDIIRYFMTIPEACQLVLEASVIGESGYIYIFDMGEPVKIFDLATRMIKLAGLVPDKDIKIEFSGLRPGEKLFEELLADAESSEKTSHEKVMKSKVREYFYHEVSPQIDAIITHALNENTHDMVLTMKSLVPEYISKNSKFELLDQQLQEEISNI